MKEASSRCTETENPARDDRDKRTPQAQTGTLRGVNSVYGFDLTVFRAINVGWHQAWLDPVFLVLSYLGLGWTQAILFLLLALHKGSRRFVLPLLLTIFVAGVPVAQGLKSLIPRDRPSNLPFAIHQENLFKSSFPSGHSTISFAAATMILLLTWDSKYRWIGPAAFVVAAMIGLSRIYRGVHWPTDVLGGACCGVASACLVWLCYPKDQWDLSCFTG